MKMVVLRLFRDVIDDTKKGIYIVYDYKTHLQEVLQAKGITDIRYQMTGEEGPDHDKTFTVCLFIDGSPAAHGRGKSKKQAEQLAAREALKEDWNEF